MALFIIDYRWYWLGFKIPLSVFFLYRYILLHGFREMAVLILIPLFYIPIFQLAKSSVFLIAVIWSTT